MIFCEGVIRIVLTHLSIGLLQVIDPDYVPTDKDIVEYAAFLQLDLDKEPELAWIARKVQNCSFATALQKSFY